MNKEKVLLGLGALITVDLLCHGVKYCYNLLYKDTTYMKLNNLKFIHITKTGGTSIEYWGKKLGLKWGNNDKEYLNSLKRCKLEKKSSWHVPELFYDKKVYDCDTFTIVRNPYTRIISEYYCKWSNGSKTLDTDTKEDFNIYIKNFLKNVQCYQEVSGLPQYLYLPVTHVLKFETLQNDFTELVEKYEKNIDTILPHINKKRECESYFTINDIDRNNIDLINKIYDIDFRLFGYEKI